MRSLRILLPLSALSLALPQAVQAIPVAKSITHWECVPIARALSGIQIIGDAHTWWGQAAGRYKRGSEPRRGAVLAFRPYGAMKLGHVAAVSKLIDDRTVLVTHSNWSPINGRRGQIERDVRVVDVSDKNDWSRVRVWYAPSQDLGTTEWPTHGFIYPDGKAPMRLPEGGVVAPAPAVAIASVPAMVHTARKSETPSAVPRLGYANMLNSKAIGTASRTVTSAPAPKKGPGLSGLSLSLDQAAEKELRARGRR
jgi:surface antigen